MILPFICFRSQPIYNNIYKIKNFLHIYIFIDFAELKLKRYLIPNIIMGNKETKIFNLLLKDPFKFPTVSVLNVPEAIRICRLLIQLDLCVRKVFIW